MRQIIKHLIGGVAFILAGFAILLYSLIAVMSLKVYELWFDGEGYIGNSPYIHMYVLFADTFITPGMFPIVLSFCFLLAKKTENLRGLGIILVILSAMFHYYLIVLSAHVTLHVLYIEPILSIAVLFWFYKYKPIESKE